MREGLVSVETGHSSLLHTAIETGGEREGRCSDVLINAPLIDSQMF